MPMFDVCAEHVQAELDVAAVLNHDRPIPQHRVRVTELPEQLTWPVGYQSGSANLSACAVAALRLYRSCRERDFRPWEALDYVEAELQRAVRVADAHGERIIALSWRAAAGYLLTWWRPVVERWRAESARQAVEVDRLLRGPSLLAADALTDHERPGG